MRDAVKGVPYDVTKEIADTTRLLNTPGAIPNQMDRLQAQSYLSQLTGGSGSNTANGTLTANQPYSAPIPGAPDTGDATGGAGTNSIFPDYSQGLGGISDANLAPGQAAAMGAGGDMSTLEWLRAKVGDVGLVLLGVVVLGVALVAASKSNQKIVMEAVKGAVVTP